MLGACEKRLYLFFRPRETIWPDHGRIEVRWRSGQETSLAPPCSNLRSFWSKYTALKKVHGTLLGLFGVPQWFGPRDIVLPLTPSVRPWTWCLVKSLWSVARCWRPPVTDRQVIVFLLRSLCRKRSSAWALSLCGDKPGGFNNRKAVRFQIGLFRTLGNDWNNIVSSTSGRNGISVKSSGRDTSWQSAQLWKFVKPWMSSHFAKEIDLSYVLTMWPESTRKDCLGKSCWLHPWRIGPRGKPRPRTVQMARLHLRPYLVPSWLEPVKLSEMAVDREVFQVLVGMLPLGGKSGMKMNEEENEWRNKYRNIKKPKRKIGYENEWRNKYRNINL